MSAELWSCGRTVTRVLAWALASLALSSCFSSGGGASGDVALSDGSEKEASLLWNCDARDILNVGSLRFREIPEQSQPVPHELTLNLKAGDESYSLDAPVRSVRYALAKRPAGSATVDVHAFQFELDPGAQIVWTDEAGEEQNAVVSRVVVNTFKRPGTGTGEQSSGNVRIHSQAGTASLPATLWFNNRCQFFKVAERLLSIKDLVAKKVILLPAPDIPSGDPAGDFEDDLERGGDSDAESEELDPNSTEDDGGLTEESDEGESSF